MRKVQTASTLLSPRYDLPPSRYLAQIRMGSVYVILDVPSSDAGSLCGEVSGTTGLVATGAVAATSTCETWGTTNNVKSQGAAEYIQESNITACIQTSHT